MEQRANVPSTSHGQPGARVMVVDDDADIANLIGEVLRDEGYVARVVSDSRTALDAFRDFQPDLVTLDVMMPRDRKSTRLNSSHLVISYAVFCLKKINKQSNV